jgi:hypothetical protein
MTTDQEHRDWLISRTPITGARCRNDSFGEHKWWTGLRKDWFASWCARDAASH